MSLPSPAVSSSLVVVRHRCQTYVASGGKPRRTASATMSAEAAVRALARKLYPQAAVGLVRCQEVAEDGTERWEVIAS